MFVATKFSTLFSLRHRLAALRVFFRYQQQQQQQPQLSQPIAGRGEHFANESVCVFADYFEFVITAAVANIAHSSVAPQPPPLSLVRRCKTRAGDRNGQQDIRVNDDGDRIERS